tara:strand:+ start:180406 stop:180957 length:552 start_codon:yes stop_codon:yes gene_type:complete
MSNVKKVSRLLSLVLRHKPEKIGIELDGEGWVDICTLLTQLEKHNREITFLELVNIVETNDKQRFTFNEQMSKIRANQGHSGRLGIDLGLKASRPPKKLFHGTVQKAIQGVKEGGLDKMSRHALHLSEDVPTAINVGSRRGDAIILEIDSGAMHADGFKFYQSKNGVWLIDNVPPKYIKFKDY